jgi:1,2-dihydroxy-3-keto-5-methylthiopentene dioxygenase
MSLLTVYADDANVELARYSEEPAIAKALEDIGVRFERWQAAVPLQPDATQQDILAAYAPQIAALSSEGGYTTADVVRLKADHPERAAMRQKFIEEHTHAEDEVRFFVEGSGAFYLHGQGQVYRLVCERNDLIRVPAQTPHWFDMGPTPHFTAIRLFTDPAGWVGHFTGSTISHAFPLYER